MTPPQLTQPEHLRREPSLQPPRALAPEDMTADTAEDSADDLCNAFRQCLPAWMEAQGLSVFELGRRTGLSGQVVENLRSGLTQLTLRNLARLAWAMDRRPSELMVEMEQAAGRHAAGPPSPVNGER